MKPAPPVIKIRIFLFYRLLARSPDGLSLMA
jgi:hypothetical protein